MNAQLRHIGLATNPRGPEPVRCSLADARANLSEHDELLLLKEWLADNGHEQAAEDFICDWLGETA